MRVNGPNAPVGLQTGKVKRAGEAGEAFELPEETGEAQAKPGARTAQAGSLGALIAAQLHGVSEKDQDERRRRRQKGVARGQNMLNALDEIKIEMLSGRLTPQQALKLLGTMDDREKDSDDPKLEAILDEIELRARVELAKLQRRDGAV